MNWNLLGHEWAVNLLKEHVAQGGLRHAYLITGPEGVGRRTLGLRLAQAINCQNPPAPGEPCFQCRACRLIEQMQHPDIVVVQAEQKGGTLKVDQVRELQRRLSLAPYEARYRVAMLLRFEEAHPSAANALLKTLEEPPAQVILILTATSPEALLPTTVSRCEVLRLRPLPLEQVSAGIASRWGLDAGQSELLAHLSGGRPGAAFHLQQDPERIEMRRGWIEDMLRLLGQRRVERFAYAETAAKDKDQLRIVLQTWISFWRDVMLAAAGASAPLANPDFQEDVERLAEWVGLESAHCTVSALDRTLGLLDKNINTRLACEVLMLDLPGLS